MILDFSYFNRIKIKIDDLLCRCFTTNGIAKVCDVSKASVCNKTIHCYGLDTCDVGCPSVYRCSSNKCVNRDILCDGKKERGCDDDSEWESGIGFKCIRNGKLCRLPQQLVYDDVQDCDGGEDLCFPITSAMQQYR